MRGTTFPCFLWPAVDAGDGLLKFPISSEENVIVGFSPIKEIEKYDLRIDDIDVKYENITLQIGGDTRFAYAFSYDDYKIGTVKEIKRFVDGRKEIDELNIYKKYELFCAIMDNKSVCGFLEDIVREDHSKYSHQEKKWAEYELNYLRKMQKASIPLDVWIDHVKKISNNIKQVEEGSMSAKDAEDEFCRFARQYATDSSELERSIREIIDLMLNIKADAIKLEVNNDSLRKENVGLKQKLQAISNRLAEPYPQPIDQWFGFYEAFLNAFENLERRKHAVTS